MLVWKTGPLDLSPAGGGGAGLCFACLCHGGLCYPVCVWCVSGWVGGWVHVCVYGWVGGCMWVCMSGCG